MYHSSCCRDARGTHRINAQTKRRTPRNGVFHELHRRAVPREKERAGAFQALLGQHLLIGLERELGAHRAVGPHDPRHLRACLVAKAEVKLRAVDRLHLNKQPGTDFDLAADTEGIDALIAGGLVRARTNDLPVVILRGAIDGVDGLAIDGKSKEIEPPFDIYWRCIKHARGTLGRCEQRKMPILIGEPDKCARCIALSADVCEQEIEGAVVVEIGYAQTYLAGQRVRGVGHQRNLTNVPGVIEIGEAHDRAARLYGQ